MAQPDNMRRMEDFLLHSTLLDQDSHQFELSLPKPDYITAPGQIDKAMATVMKARPRPLTTFDEFIFQFWPSSTYASDEEVRSPLDDHPTRPYSRTTSFSSNSSMPELLDDIAGNVEKAQTVVIRSAGKAKMVSTPKIDPSRRSMCLPPIVVTETRPSIVIPARRSSINMPMSARLSQDSRTSSSGHDSISSAAPCSPASTAPSSLFDDLEDAPAMQHERTLSRHVDLMQAAAAVKPPASPVSPGPQQSSAFGSDFDFDFSAQRESAPSIRRKSKFTSGFALYRIGKTFTRRDSTRSDMENVTEPDPVTFTQQVPQPKRYSSGRPKLVARGADERAATITLPPFPDE